MDAPGIPLSSNFLRTEQESRSDEKGSHSKGSPTEGYATASEHDQRAASMFNEHVDWRCRETLLQQPSKSCVHCDPSTDHGIRRDYLTISLLRILTLRF